MFAEDSELTLCTSPFIILTMGRSGSHFLQQSLNNQDNCSCSFEIFNRSIQESPSFNFYLNEAKWRYILSRFYNRESLSQSNLNFPLAFQIQKFLTRFFLSCQEDVCGFNLTYDQWQAYPQTLKILVQQKVKIIWLTREDKLSAVLSLMKARKTGIYNREEPAQDQNKWSFDPHEVNNQLHWVSQCEEELSELIGHTEILRINYESLFSDFEEHFIKITDFLDVKNPDLTKTSLLQKMNPLHLSDWVENLTEIKATCTT